MPTQRISSPKLETSTLRSITEAEETVASWLFPRVSEADFSWEPALDFFKRIRVLTRKTGQIPRWEDLLEDLAISKDARTAMENQNSQVAESRREAKLIISKLAEYRQARGYFYIQKHIATALKGDKIDLEEVGETVADMLTKARTGIMEESMMHFGGKQLAKKDLRELLNSGDQDFIPTGIRAFDSQNGGVPRNTAWLISAPTSGFKSGMAINVGMNQALIGAKVSLNSLEMSKIENNRRILSRLTSMPLQTINNLKNESKTTRRIVIDAWRDFHNRIAKNGGRLTINCPHEDVSMEDILMRMRPRGYDNIIVDYVGLLKGMDGDDQWRKLGGALRVAKIFAGSNQNIVTCIAQLDADTGNVRYSRTMVEHASLAWFWNRPDESGITTVKQPKARNLKPFDFPLKINYATMTVSDVDLSQITVEEKPKTKKEVIRLSAKRRTSDESKQI